MANVTQSRALLGKSYPGGHRYGPLWKNDPNLGKPVANSKGTYVTPAGYQQTWSYRTSKLNSAEEQYASMSTVDLKRQVGDDYRTRFDNGHEFWTFKRENDITSPDAVAYSANGNTVYRGPVYPSLTSVFLDPYPSYTVPDNQKVILDGSRAIESCAPTAPEAGLAQFLGELREKLPAIPGTALRKDGISARAIGGEHLNSEFGIKPTISDIQKLAKQVLNFRQVLDQFKRDAGVDRHIRRKRHLYDDHTTSVVLESGNLPIRMIPLSGSDPTFTYFGRTSLPYRVTDSVRQSARFSGAFTYHLAEADSFLGKIERYEQLANQLLGSRFGVDTFWELTPWSWLIDWEIDVGGFLHNVQLLHNDSLVLRYGYIMHETRAERMYVPREGLVDRLGHTVTLPIAYYSYHRKSRTRATPYGFGLDLSLLTPRKWAILAALGMTKSDRTLRSDNL